MKNRFTEHAVATAAIVVLLCYAVFVLLCIFNANFGLLGNAIALILIFGTAILFPAFWILEYAEYDGDPCYGC